MQVAPLPPDEARRLDALQRLDILDTDAEAEFDALVQAASLVCQAPISLISLVDAHRQWFKARHGLDARETSRDVAFCAHAILDSEVLEVADATQDARFHDNPLVTQAPDIRFYAGVPLTLGDGSRVGTLCVIDRVPRRLTAQQREILRHLGLAAAHALEGRRALKREQQLAEARAAAEAEVRRFKDEFVAAAAHELRTPMTSLMGFAELLLTRDCTPEQQRRHVERIHRQSAHLLALTQDMLDLASLDARGGLELALEPLDLLRWLRDVLQDYNPPDGRDAPRLQVLTPPPAVQADPQRLRQVLVNLLSNAYKYSPGGGAVRVGLAATPDGGAALSVQDEGLGMTADQLARVTERFYRADRGNGIPGTGLGMSIVQDLVHLHGGRLDLASTPGQGTTVTVTLPPSASGD